MNGSRYGVDSAEVPGILLGNVFLGVQPDRGADYHDKDAAPPEKYVNFYRYLFPGLLRDLTAAVHDLKQAGNPVECTFLGPKEGDIEDDL